ncbi:hypothetical protein JCM10212_005842 [Sporobolomyces blumeae]
MTTASETPLGRYLAESGGSFHPQLYPEKDAFGTSIYTKAQLEPSTTVVSCPFSLCITPHLARASIPSALFAPPTSDSTSTGSPSSARPARQEHHELLALYLVLHLVSPALIAPHEPALQLDHVAYVEALPTSESMRTTLYFSAKERDLLRGSNLQGATVDRERGWRDEWNEVTGWIVDENVRREVTWERWLWACTIISSRAFPSHLLDSDKSRSTPVLFPGIDMLNHQPTAKLTWSSDVHVETSRSSPAKGKDGKGMLSIVVDEVVPAGSQVFNTYGAKSSEELLLGYGFVLPPPNPADCVALKLSLPPNCSETLFALLHELGLEGMRHFVGRSGELPDGLRAQMRLLLSMPEEVDELASDVKTRKAREGKVEWRDVVGFLGWENELDVLDLLEGMLESKLEALAAVDVDAEAGAGVRDDVKEMIKVYRQGQIDVLKKALEHREQLMEDAISRAQEDGVELAFDDGDDE